MSDINFHMAGAGKWQKFFSSEAFYTLYERIYPEGMNLNKLNESDRDIIYQWDKVGFVEVKNNFVNPKVPVFTEPDYKKIKKWLIEVEKEYLKIINKHKEEYYSLARFISDGEKIPEEYIFTILLCAYTLDAGTLDKLEDGILGQPPSRENSGKYFLWGEKIDISRNYFGINTYEIPQNKLFSVIWMPEMRRSFKNVKSLTIPVFNSKVMEKIEKLCSSTSEELAQVFSSSIEKIKLNELSFANCSLKDVLCMLFHVGYSYVTDSLIEQEILSDFPKEITDSWGMWIWNK
ncbi:unnamed protein product [marine sediment metagenome]|uniref:Uncharacterized protein n=1 Tax=marine sediment metagenome TaxID=412755 RepID=X0ZTQ6_9ZZZZ